MAEDKKLIFKTAYIYFQEGRWDRAIAEFKRLVALDPDDLNARNMLADAFLKKGNMKEAYEEYAYAAEGYSKKGEGDKANAIYRKMAKLEVNNLDAAAQKKLRVISLVVRGDQEYEKGNYEEAAQAYQEVANIDPSNMEVSAKLADIYARLGRNREAATQFSAVAKFYMESRLFKKALLIYQKVVELDPANVEARMTLGDLLAREGQELEARKEYQSVAEYFISQNQLDKAQQCCQKAIQLKSIDAHYFLGEIFIRRGQFDDARSELESFLKIKSNHVGAQFSLGLALLGKGALDEAIAQFGRILGRQPDHVESLEKMAEIYEKKGSVPDAIVQHLAMADVLSGQKILDRAEAALRQALALDAGHVDAHRKLGELFEMRGMRREAGAEFVAAHEAAKAQGLVTEAGHIEAKIRAIDPALLGGAPAPAAASSAPPPAAPAPAATPVPPAAEAAPPPAAAATPVAPAPAPPPVPAVPAGLPAAPVPVAAATPPPPVRAAPAPVPPPARPVAPSPVPAAPPAAMPAPLTAASVGGGSVAPKAKAALTPEQRAQRYIVMGRSALKQGLSEEALDYFQQAQQIVPDDAELKATVQDVLREFARVKGGGKKPAVPEAKPSTGEAAKPPAGEAAKAPEVAETVKPMEAPSVPSLANLADAPPPPPPPAAAPEVPTVSAETIADIERRIREQVQKEFLDRQARGTASAPSEETRQQVLAQAGPPEEPAPAVVSPPPSAPPAPAAAPREEPLTETMADLYLRQGHVEEALKILETLAAREPGRSDLARRVAEVRAKLGRGEAPAAPARTPEPPPAPRIPEPEAPVPVAAGAGRSKPRVSYV